MAGLPETYGRPTAVINGVPCGGGLPMGQTRHMKWRSPHRKLEGRTDFARRPAAIIDDVFTNLVAEEKDEVRRCEASLMFARRRLEEAETNQLAWRRHGTFDHVLGLRAILMAQIADLDHRTQPPGANLAGMLAFLNEHHPPVLSADPGHVPPDRGHATEEHPEG